MRNITTGDVLLLSNIDGGEIDMRDGYVEMTGGFESATYLSLFGGNEKDNATDATKKFQFWGNLTEENTPDRKMISRTQNLLIGLSAVPSNLNLVEQAIRLDLNWMLIAEIVDEFIIDLSIPSKNRIEIKIQGIKDQSRVGETIFEKNWIAQANL
jgi:hypothetical protein